MTYHKSTLAAALTLVFTALVYLEASASIVYVKPTACGTGDGSSWANAMGSVSNALFTAIATGGTREVRMSKGIHKWLSGVWIGRDVKGVFHPDVSGGYKFAIRGGYAGVSEDEVADVVANPTYLSFDVNDDDRWVKRDIRTQMLTGSSTTTDLGPVVDNDGNVVIPEPEGDYEIAHIDTTKAGDNAVFINLTDNGTGNVVEFSDFTFLCGGSSKRYLNKGNNFIEAVSAAYKLKNITFLGHYNILSGAIAYITNPSASSAVTGETIFDNVKFLWTYANIRIIGIGGCNYETFDKVTIRGAYFANSVQTGSALYFRFGTGCIVKDCVFEKCYATSSSGNYGPSAIVGMEQGTGHLYTNCVFRKNCARGLNIASCINFRSTSTSAAQQMRVVDCLFEGNLNYATASSGSLNCLGAVMLGMNNDVLLNCTFKDNVVTVKPTGSCSGAYAAPLTLGSRTGSASTTDPRRSVLNCTFASNTVEVAEGSVETPLKLSRSILVNSFYLSNPFDFVISGCTFAGDASARPDLYWTGLDKTYPVQVLNSLFNGPVGDGYVPIVVDDSGVLTVNRCLLNGITALPSGVSGENNVFLDLPMGAWEYPSDRIAPVLRPAARIPELRTAADLNYVVDNYALYPLDANDAHLYKTAPTTSVPAEPLADALGVARPTGSVTIGAVQTLTAQAESGATLYVNASPADAASFSGGGTIQVVDLGGGVVSITVTATDPNLYTFVGWKRPDGTIYSESPTLVIGSLSSDLQLTAVFSAPKVTYVFDLGIAGTFTENGLSHIEKELTPGDALTVPAFVIDTEKVLPMGWDVTPPATVGTSSQTFTYLYIEKKFRILRVDTTLAAGGDGSGWAMAMTNIQEAIDTAGLWQGEVWIRQGVHPIGKTTSDKSLKMRNNVKILGGFEGLDGKYEDDYAELAARDVGAFRSVLTADVGLDDVWCAGTTVIKIEETNDFTVVANGVYREPDFDENVSSWYSHGTGKTANISTVIDNSEADIDSTAVLDGVTIYGGAAMLNCFTAKPIVRNCTFAGMGRVSFSGNVTLSGCEFVGVYNSNIASPVLEMTGLGALATVSTVSNCTFRYCRASGRAILHFSCSSGYLTVRNCVFDHGICESTLEPGCMGAAIGSEHGGMTLRDCTFKSVRSNSGLAAVCLPSAASSVVTNCLFEGCSISQAGTTDSTGSYPLSVMMTHQLSGASQVKVFNATFRWNTISRTVGNNVNSKNAQTAVVVVYGPMQFANCTFDGNTVTCTSPLEGYPAKSAVVLARGTSKSSMVHCSVNGNTAADGDLLLAERTGTNACYVVNSILWGGTGHVAATAEGLLGPELHVLNSVVHGLNSSAAFVAEAVDNMSGSPSLKAWYGTAPVMARRPSGDSAARAVGRSVYVDESVLAIPTDAEETAFVNVQTGAAYVPSEGKAMLADVFGVARPAGRITAGAMQETGAGLSLLLR